MESPAGGEGSQGNTVGQTCCNLCLTADLDGDLLTAGTICKCAHMTRNLSCTRPGRAHHLFKVKLQLEFVSYANLACLCYCFCCSPTCSSTTGGIDRTIFILKKKKPWLREAMSHPHPGPGPPLTVNPAHLPKKGCSTCHSSCLYNCFLPISAF